MAKPDISHQCYLAITLGIEVIAVAAPAIAAANTLSLVMGEVDPEKTEHTRENARIAIFEALSALLDAVEVVHASNIIWSELYPEATSSLEECTQAAIGRGKRLVACAENVIAITNSLLSAVDSATALQWVNFHLEMAKKSLGRFKERYP